MMYEKSEAVKKLNAVEGFEPKEYLRKEEKTEGISLYLDTKYRLLWFRLVYPNGKIHKIPKAINKDCATFEARIYKDVNDAPENFLANGFASRYKDETNESFGMNFVETAETAALGRALKDAGFGTQFCDVALPNDAMQVDAGVQISFDAANENMPSPDDDEIPELDGEANADTKDATDAKGSTKKEKGASKDEPEPSGAEEITLSEDMPVEELLSKMTLEYAKGITVNYGYDSGKTLGYLAEKKPSSIQYHATRSNNNLVKAGAMYLLEQAQEIA